MITFGKQNLGLQEKYIWISLPWRIWAYSLYNERIERQRPTFGIYWGKPAPHATKVRWGWVYGPRCVGEPAKDSCQWTM